MHGQFNTTSHVIDVEYFFPVFTPIDRLENSPLLIVAPQATDSTDLNDVRLFRMNHHTPSLEGLLKPHVLPGLATVGRPQERGKLAHGHP